MNTRFAMLVLAAELDLEARAERTRGEIAEESERRRECAIRADVYAKIAELVRIGVKAGEQT